MPRIFRSFVVLMAIVFCVPAIVNAAVGYTPGSFKVNDTGAATYSIPIAVPPGAAGIQPSLSLAYSSQSGNGLVGMGFSLQGLSAITRCPQTYATDGNPRGIDLTYNDRYCLDGQRLILVSGTYGYANSEYRTERDTLTRIVAYGVAGNGPAYFIAQTKSGQTIEFGNTVDARILATGKTTATVWNLNRITDTVGNYLTVTYTQNATTREYYPQRIDYAGNVTQGTPTSSSVQFVYATRTDTFTGYIAGSSITSTHRLTNVQVFEGANSIRDYRLTYDSNQANTMTARSRLTSLTECDSNLAGAACLPATAFGWSTGGVGFNPTPISTGNTGAYLYSQAIDANGDGKTDLVYCASATDTWKIAISTGAGFSTPINTLITCTNYQYAKPLDYNNDGLMDLLVANSDGTWHVLQSTGSGFVDTPTGHASSGYSNNAQLIDVNGDGRQDLVIYDGTSVQLSLNNGAGFSAAVNTGINVPYFTYARPIDYNGDGRMDVIYANTSGNFNNCNVLQSTGSGFNVLVLGGSTWCLGLQGLYYNQSLDVNGDGLEDWIFKGKVIGSSQLSLWGAVNTGGNFTATLTQSPTATDSVNGQQPIDYNGDGRMELLRIIAGKWHILKFSSTFSSPQDVDTGITAGDCCATTKVVDFNGDGLADALYYKTGSGWNVLLHNAGDNGIPDQLTSITNGLGAQTTVTYKPLTNSAGTVYTKSTGVAPQFPQQDVQGSMYVVSQYATSDGLGTLYPVTYSYQGARINTQGRGFSGFSQITSTDTRTNIVTQTNYYDTTIADNWPMFGTVTSVNTSYNNATIHSVVNTPSYYRYGTANAYYYFPYISQTVETTYELPPSGSSYVVSTVTTNNTYHSSCASYDYYCDLTTITVATTAGSSTFTKTTTNTYDTPNTVSWILGRLTNANVTSTLPSGTYQARESSFTYYPSGLLWTEVVEPNGNVGGVTNMTQTTTYTYDGFGNKTGATVSGADGVSRPATASNTASTASAPYSYSAGRFETGLTNAASQGETRVYDARFGTVYTLTGPNGLSSNWRYDTFGRKSLETRADGTTTTWTYNLCGTCVSNAKYYVVQTTSGAPTVTVYYDILDREVRTQTVGYNGALIYKDTVYDSKGRVYQVSQPYYSTDTPYWSTYGYDALNRVTSITIPTPSGTTATPLTTTAYNGLSTTVTAYRDGLALNTTQTKDAIGKLVSVIDANNNITRYQYDPFGNLTQVTDPVGNLTTMSYDLRGRKLTMIDPDMGSWQYKYDSVGDLTWQQDAKGQQVTMAYNDPLGRMTSRTEAEGTTTWTYDSTTLSGSAAKGKLSQVTWPGGSRTYHYDTLGRPDTETTTLSGVTYTITTTYDGNSRRDTLTYPDGFSVRNNYNTYGYLSSVTNTSTGDAYWSAPAYNAAGQTTAFNLGNTNTPGNVVLTTVRQYDPATGLLTGISTGVGTGSAAQYLTYQYDTLGDLKQRVDGNQANLTENFGYDNLNRLTSAAVVGGASKSMTYDALGNITSKSDVGTYTYDPAHPHAVRTAGTGSYTNDANGNQITGPNGRVIQYTSFNQPLSITQGGKVDSFVYGGDHLRVSETTTDGTTIILQPRMDQGAHYEELHKTDGTVEQKNFIYAGKEFVAVYTARPSGAPDTRYYHKDHLGSVDTITDESGNAVNRLSYDAWGKRRNGNWTDATSPISSITRHGFTGHEMLDDMGLVNMNGRVYDPTLGRFLSADPTMQDPTNLQVLNRYSYAGNNPLAYVDPSGYGFFSDLWSAVKGVVKIVAAVVAAYYVFLYASAYFSILSGNAIVGGILGGAVSGFTAGFIGSGGNLQAGLYGAMTGAVFGGIGAYADVQMTPGLDPSKDPWAEGGMNRVLAHAVGGGITSALQGQKFGPGALAAGFTQEFAPGITRTFNASGATGVVERTMAAAVVGGTASVIGGGRFANGAKTAAFARLFNDELLPGMVERGNTHIQQTRGGWADEQVYGPEHSLPQDKLTEGACELVCTPLEIAADYNPLQPDSVDTGIKAGELASDAARSSTNSTMSSLGRAIGFAVPIAKGFQFFSNYQDARNLCAYSCANQDVYK